MGKTKTAVIGGAPGEKLTGKAAYEAKKKKQEESKKQRQADAKKGAVSGVGLKGGERIKVIGADDPIPEKFAEESEAGESKRQPKVRSEKYKTARKKVDGAKLYAINEAIKLVKDTSYSKFEGSVELHLSIKKDTFNQNIELPHSTGISKVIEIASEKTIKKLEGGKVDFDILLSTKEMMPLLVPFAKLLGPRGLMPNPKNGTLIKDKKDAKKFAGNTIRVKTEKKAPVIHVVIGKVKQPQKELKENYEEIISKLGPKQVVKAHLAPTMGPSVKLKIN